MLLSEVLKEKTKANHDRLEAQMYVKEIFAGTLTCSQYCDLMQINYAATVAIEDDIFSALSDDLQSRLRIETRRKKSALEEDLKALDIQNFLIDNFPKPLYANIAQALGGMYVMEGATLGGNVIARQLKKVTGLSHQPFHFYNVYGSEIGSKWKTFKEILDSCVPSENFDQCVNAANETFDFYQKVALNVANEVNC